MFSTQNYTPLKRMDILTNVFSNPSQVEGRLVWNEDHEFVIKSKNESLGCLPETFKRMAEIIQKVTHDLKQQQDLSLQDFDGCRYRNLNDCIDDIYKKHHAIQELKKIEEEEVLADSTLLYRIVMSVYYFFRRIQINKYQQSVLIEFGKLKCALADFENEWIDGNDDRLQRAVDAMNWVPGLISKVASCETGVLIINKDQTVNSKDGSGEREHYKLTLISKDNQEIEIGKDSIDTKTYGDIKQIVIRDGKKDITLENNETTQRIIKYMTAIDFDVFRLEINKDVADHNNCYSNKNQRFDCQRFCHYVQYGKEGEYNPWSRHAYTDAFKNEGALHSPGHFYRITAYTTDFGKNSRYSREDMSLHYYVCLADDVFVSKFGGSNILFTSYNQIIDAYCPARFIKGVREEVKK